MKLKSLRAWLRREPVPHAVKVRLEDGEEKEIHIPGDIRNRWKTVEASVLAANAVAVQLYDKKGTVLRAQELEHVSEDDDEGTPEQKSQSRNLKEWTGMLQAVMSEQNTSFSKGVEAASQSQDSLVELVDSLASHFATALTNIHNIVANMAVIQQQHAEQVSKLQLQLAAALSEGGEQPNSGVDGMIGRLVASTLAGSMSPATSPAAAPAPAKKKEH